jgi:DNA replication and repair protein RecF
MRLEGLRIRDFRNIPHADISFQGRRTVVLGDNGQGKTNLLEAIHLLCHTRAFRSSRLKQLQRHPKEGQDLPGPLFLEGDFHTRRAGHRQARALVKEGALIFELDGSRCRGRDYFGQLPLVLLSPESLDVSQGGPDARRRTLDRLMSAASPLYLDQLMRYQRALRQRGALLAQEGPSAQGVELWEEEMASSAMELGRRRREFMVDLGRRVGDIHLRLFHPEHAFHLSLESSLGPECDPAQLAAAWARDREGDARRGWARLGPHRDELPVLLDGLPLRSFGSQGQHKLFMLCLTLAETELLTELTGESPLLLLDDLFGLLDDEKIRALAGAVDPALQVIISTTSLRHAELLAELGQDLHVLHCRQGCYTEAA